VKSSKTKETKFITFQERKKEIIVNEAKGAEWVKFNGGQSGVYRLKTSPKLAEKLSIAVSSLSLSPVDRLGVQNDAFALAKAGLINLSQVLTLVKGYKNEKTLSSMV